MLKTGAAMFPGHSAVLVRQVLRQLFDLRNNSYDNCLIVNTNLATTVVFEEEQVR